MNQGYDIWDKVRKQVQPPEGGVYSESPDDQLRRQLEALYKGEQQPQDIPQDTLPGGAPDSPPMQNMALPRSPIPDGMQRQGPMGPRRRDAPRRPPNPYETPGDPDANDFLRRRATEGPPPDEPFPQAWEDPREFDRVRTGAYNAGLNGDNAAMDQILNGPYRNTPLGRELWKAYQQGKADRNARGARR